jgi:hypothetical protein
MAAERVGNGDRRVAQIYEMLMDRSKRRSTKRSGKSERTRRIAATAAVMAVLTAGFFAATETKIELSAAKPTATPSDDEIYTGSILFVPDDGKVCRRFLFDNRTGQLSYGGLVDCERAYYQNRGEPPIPMSIARTQAISETFRHH